MELKYQNILAGTESIKIERKTKTLHKKQTKDVISTSKKSVVYFDQGMSVAHHISW